MIWLLVAVLVMAIVAVERREWHRRLDAPHTSAVAGINNGMPNNVVDGAPDELVGGGFAAGRLRVEPGTASGATVDCADIPPTVLPRRVPGTPQQTKESIYARHSEVLQR